MTIRDHITEELGCYLVPMLKWVTLLHKYKLCKICPKSRINSMILELSSLLFIINKPWNCFPFLLVLLCWSQLTEAAAEIDGAWWQMANCSGDRIQEAGVQVARCLLDPVLQCGSPVTPPHLLSCLHVCVTLLYVHYKLTFPNISDTITIFWEELSVILYYVTYSTTLLTRLILHLWFS